MNALDAANPPPTDGPQTSDIADGVVLLASGRAGYMTATTVVIDGSITQSSVGL